MWVCGGLRAWQAHVRMRMVTTEGLWAPFPHAVTDDEEARAAVRIPIARILRRQSYVVYVWTVLRHTRRAQSVLESEKHHNP